MIHSYYTSSAGILALQNGLDVSANNISNISTTGYKAQECNFADLVNSKIQNIQGAKANIGNGVKLNNTDTVYTVGSPEQTGRALDFALTDANTFFAVQNGQGIRYTRSGNFQKSVENGTTYLVTADGGYVLDAQGQRIQVTDENHVTPGVFTFPNADGLERDGNTSFVATNISGLPTAVDNPGVKNQCLEASTVDLSNELTQVIQLQRAFEMNSKMAQISDEIMQTVNGLRG